MSERQSEQPLTERLLGLLGIEPVEPLEPLLGDEDEREAARARNAKRRSRNAYKRRTARARLLGYRSYYDYRIHNYGELPPERKVSPSMRERLRGHRSYRDLVFALERLPAGAQVAPMGLGRDPASGRWQGVSFLLLYPDGREREYVLRGRQASEEALRGLRDNLDALGIGWLNAPSLDVFAAGGQGLLAA